MTTPTEQIAEQNEAYRQSFMNDVKTRNEKVMRMMDDTAAQQAQQDTASRLEAMNSLTQDQRRRLMRGEKLEDLIDITSSFQSKYYNSSNEAVKSIPKNKLFEYQIGEYLMAYETNEVTLNEQLKIIDLPVVVYNSETEDYQDVTYTITDEMMFEILDNQVNPPPPPPPSEMNTNDSQFPQFQHEDSSSVQLSDSVRKVQDNLFEQLLSIYQWESPQTHQVYTREMEIRIQQMLDNRLFPFQIVNNLITEFTQ